MNIGLAGRVYDLVAGQVVVAEQWAARAVHGVVFVVLADGELASYRG